MKNKGDNKVLSALEGTYGRTWHMDRGEGLRKLSQNELLTYLWYLNFTYTFRGLEVI